MIEGAESSFPADHELVAFFEAEPTILDPGVPWFYNTLDFETKRRRVLVQCRIAPAYGDIDVRLSKPDGVELTRAKLQGFRSISLMVNSHGEVLIATSNGEPPMLCLMLKPRVWLGVGNFQSIPF
jgi:hypothetical protein